LFEEGGMSEEGGKESEGKVGTLLNWNMTWSCKNVGGGWGLME